MKYKESIEELFEKYEEDILTLPESLKQDFHNRNEVLADLRKRISVNENVLLDKFFELDNDVAYEEIKNGFIYGFSLGSKLMSQIV